MADRVFEAFKIGKTEVWSCSGKFKTMHAEWKTCEILCSFKKERVAEKRVKKVVLNSETKNVTVDNDKEGFFLNNIVEYQNVTSQSINQIVVFANKLLVYCGEHVIEMLRHQMSDNVLKKEFFFKEILDANVNNANVQLPSHTPELSKSSESISSLDKYLIGNGIVDEVAVNENDTESSSDDVQNPRRKRKCSTELEKDAKISNLVIGTLEKTNEQAPSNSNVLIGQTPSSSSSPAVDGLTTNTNNDVEDSVAPTPSSPSSPAVDDLTTNTNDVVDSVASKLVPQTQRDESFLHSEEIESYRMKLESLRAEIIPSNLLKIKSSSMILNNHVSADHPIVTKLAENALQEEKLRESDPIVVVESGNGTYRVVSGSKRVKALSLCPDRMVKCSMIKPEDEFKMEIFSFLRKVESHSTVDKIRIISLILEQLEIDEEVLEKWSAKVVEIVFRPLIKCFPSCLIRLASMKSLSTCIIPLLKAAPNISIKAIQKFAPAWHRNPSAVEEMIGKSVTEGKLSSSDLIQKLSLIKVDISHYLKKKNVSASVIQDCIQSFGNNTLFPDFLQKTVINPQRNIAFATIKRKFEEFEKHEITPAACTEVVLWKKSELPSVELFIIQKKGLELVNADNCPESASFLVFGKHLEECSGNVHVEMPDKLCNVDNDGYIYNTLKLSITEFDDGIILSRKELVKQFKDKSINLRSLMQMADLKLRYSCIREIYVEPTGVPNDILMGMVTNKERVYTNSEDFAHYICKKLNSKLTLEP